MIMGLAQRHKQYYDCPVLSEESLHYSLDATSLATKYFRRVDWFLV